MPPVTYGQEFEEDERFEGPYELERGQKYGVEVGRLALDAPNGTGAVYDVEGCATFTR